MGVGEFWFESAIPFSYWIGVVLIVIIAVMLIPRLSDARYRIVFVFSSVLLVVSIRMVFATVFTSVPSYEPDAALYMNILSSWVKNGVDFGIAGAYQHDYPLSFLVGFTFVKLGVSVDSFFRCAPLVIYSIQVILLYLIVSEIVPEDKRYAAISAFLLANSSIATWITVHYCPDLMGSLFFLVALLLSIRFAKKGVWSLKILMPVLASIFLLILSHHLSTLYFIVTLFGMAVSAWFFKNPNIKGKLLSFFILGVVTYTAWFVYGTLVYPDFFNVYVYFSGFGSATTLAQQAPLINSVAFAVYPFFILLLALLGLFISLNVRSIKSVFKLIIVFFKRLTHEKLANENMLLFYVGGFISILVLCAISIPVPVLFMPRVLEVLLVGLYPLASLALLKFVGNNPSRNRILFVLIIFILITLIDVHRYYTVEQRRVILA